METGLESTTKRSKFREKLNSYYKKDVDNWRLIYIAICIFFFGVQMYYYLFGGIATLSIRAIHLACVMALAFLPVSKDSTPKKLILIAVTIFGIVSAIYFIENNYRMKTNMMNMTTLDLIMGGGLVALICYGSKRKLGWIMPILALIFLAYALWGQIIPGAYGHKAFSLLRVVNILYTGTEGIWGTALGVIVNTVFLFMILSGFLSSTGAGEFFIDIATALCGKAAGGPAKIAVVGSMLMGSISGSAIANTAAVGSFTIPMMKKCGYKSVFAGAIEATASTGGQIMPPIMGAGAFILAEMAGIPYKTIVLVSFFPAFLYYVALFLAVHFEARKRGLLGLPAELLPNAKGVLKKEGIYALPLVILLVMILVFDFSVAYSCAFAILALVVIGLVKKKGYEKWKFLVDGIEDAGRSVAPISLACASAGIVVGVIQLTGLGYNFSSTLLHAANDSLFLALMLVFLMGLVLGMGLPTVAAFIVMISVAGPGLTNLGLPVLLAYLITFWFSQTSAITPPVCLAAYTAAGIAKAPPFQVGLRACRLGFPLLFIPFMMAYRPEIMVTGDYAWMATVASMFMTTLGTISLSGFFIGHMWQRFHIWDYALSFVAGVCSFWPSEFSDIIGLVTFALLIVSQIVERNRRKKLGDLEVEKAAPSEEFTTEDLIMHPVELPDNIIDA